MKAASKERRRRPQTRIKGILIIKGAGKVTDNTSVNEEVGIEKAPSKCGDPDKQVSRHSKGNAIWLPAMKKI